MIILLVAVAAEGWAMGLETKGLRLSFSLFLQSTSNSCCKQNGWWRQAAWCCCCLPGPGEERGVGVLLGVLCFTLTGFHVLLEPVL